MNYDEKELQAAGDAARENLKKKAKFNIYDKVYCIEINYNYKRCCTCGHTYEIAKKIIKESTIIEINIRIAREFINREYVLESRVHVLENCLYKTRKEAGKALKESEEK